KSCWQAGFPLFFMQKAWNNPVPLPMRFGDEKITFRDVQKKSKRIYPVPFLLLTVKVKGAAQHE
ncbi:MAG: hypothetical protein ACK5LX_06975, partial [Oscillospiraceae bacterium]